MLVTKIWHVFATVGVVVKAVVVCTTYGTYEEGEKKRAEKRK